MEIIFKEVEYNKFHNLNFTISSEDITGITGKDKSNILKIINAEYITKGTLTYNDIKLDTNNQTEIRKKISLVKDQFYIEPNLDTVKDYMEFIIKYYKLIIKDTNKKMVDSLKIVGLSKEYLDKKISKLSSSEIKLIQIAISLLSNPEVILLDEPFETLDTKNIKKIVMLLTKLKDQYKKTIVIASTNSDMLYKYTTKMIFIKNNKVFLTGPTKEVYKKVEYLTKHKFEIPDIVLFTSKAVNEKKVHIDYHRDIRDLIKDIYKHV